MKNLAVPESPQVEHSDTNELRDTVDLWGPAALPTGGLKWVQQTCVHQQELCHPGFPSPQCARLKFTEQNQEDRHLDLEGLLYFRGDVEVVVHMGAWATSVNKEKVLSVYSPLIRCEDLRICAGDMRRPREGSILGRLTNTANDALNT